MTAVAFLDTETTGLDPYLHEVWEVGLILRDDEGNQTEKVWHLPVDLSKADPTALNIGRFHDRYGCAPAERIAPVEMGLWAHEFVTLTRDAHLVGAVISFDAERLWRLLRRCGECPMWHYHLIDVEALAVGFLAARGFDDVVKPPWKSDEITTALGLVVSDEDKHTALGDARWAMAIYDAVMSAR